MHYGAALPIGGECGDPRFLLELAETAEASGWDGVFLEDYVWYQGDPAVPTCDPWAVLAALAARTRRVRLGLEVAALPRDSVPLRVNERILSGWVGALCFLRRLVGQVVDAPPCRKDPASSV